MAQIQENGHDDKLGLTRKEKELLELLESQPGRCFSRGFLLQKIWGYSDETKTRTVDVHVSRLRKKIERSDREIHTVVSQGYVLQYSAREGGQPQIFETAATSADGKSADSQRAFAVGA